MARVTSHERRAMGGILWVAAVLAAAMVLGLVLVEVAHAEVNTAVDHISYDGNGTTKTFTFPFGIFAASHLRVVCRTVATGAEVVQTLNSSYTMTDNDSDGDYWDGPGGSVTFTTAPATGVEVWISRAPPLTQATDVDGSSTVRLNVLEDAIDALVCQNQYLRGLLYRVPMLPETERQIADMNVPATGSGYFYLNGDRDLSLATPTAVGDVNMLASWHEVLEGDANGTERIAVKGELGADHVFDVRDYGADANGSDESSQIQAALDAAEAGGGGTLFFPAGTYLANVTGSVNGTYLDAPFAQWRGAGPNATRLASADANNPVLNITGDAAWEWPWSIRDLAFDNVDQDANGIDVNNVSGVLGLYVENVALNNCDIGFKNLGSLWYSFNHVTFNRSNVGTWIEDIATMNSGCGRFTNCNWYIHDQAAIYINGNAAGAAVESLVFDGGIIEGNPGAGVVVRNWNGYWPLELRDIYFEGNGTLDSITLDGLTISQPNDIYLTDSRNVWLKGCKLAGGGTHVGGIDVNDSTLYTEHCFYQPGSFAIKLTGDSEVVHYCPTLNASNRVIDGNQIVVGGWRVTPANADVVTARVPIRPFSYDYSATNLWPYGSCSVAFTPADANGLAYSFTTIAGPVYGQALSVYLPKESDNMYDGVQLFANWSETSGKIYVWSLDVKSDTNDCEICLMSSGSGNLVNASGTPGSPTAPGIKVSASAWRRYYGIGISTATLSTGDLYVYNVGDANETVYLSNMQLVQFDNHNAALDFIRDNRYAVIASGIEGPSTPLMERLAVVDVTNAQIKDLADTAVTLVAAPGAGKWLEFCGASLWLDYGSNALAEPSSPDDLIIAYTNESGPAVCGAIAASGFITATADTGAFAVPIDIDGTAAANLVNKALVLANTGGDYTGNAGNDTVIRVIVHYRIHDGLGL